MYYAIRDLRRSGRRFLLVGIVIALVAMLSTVLVGLTEGLVEDGTSGLSSLPLDHLAMQEGSEAVFSRSTVNSEALREWRAVDGAEASPLGVSFVNAAAAGGGPNIDVALVGIEQGSFMADLPEIRTALERGPGLVLSEEVKSERVEVGDEFRFAGSRHPLPVLGFTSGGSYGHVPIGYVDLDEWRDLTYGNPSSDRFSAVALKLPDDSGTSATERETGTELLSKRQAYDGSPGYKAEMSTMSLIRFFLLLISALVVGAFFTVLIVERKGQIALMRAMGATGSYVIRDGIGQMAIVQFASTVVGCAAGAAVIVALEGGPVPVSLGVTDIVTAGILLSLAGLAGTLVSLRRVSGIEPGIALSGGLN